MNEIKCKECGDTGFIPTKIIREGIEYEAVKRCCCFLERKVVESIPVKYRGAWNNSGYAEDMEEMLNEFLKGDKVTLIMWGNTGVGKTKLAYMGRSLCALKYGLSKTGFITGVDLGRLLYKRSKSFYNLGEGEEYENLINLNYVVIDDFYSCDTIRDGNFIAEFESFWGKLSAAKIIITMNGNPEIINSEYPTTYSRLIYNSLVVKVVKR